VSLLEILRSYAEAYAEGAHNLALISTLIFKNSVHGTDVRNDKPLLGRLHGHLMNLAEHCEHLPMTALAVKALLTILEREDIMAKWEQPEMVLHTSIATIENRLTDELSLNLFFKLPQDRKKYFDEPLSGWKEVTDRFPETMGNVEEMSKCFALSRYAASVFHAVRAIESGLIPLGTFLGVNDPHSGWTAVTSKLATLVVKTKYTDLSQQFKDCFPFLE
jgi:hypothetical protein